MTNDEHLTSLPVDLLPDAAEINQNNVLADQLAIDLVAGDQSLSGFRLKRLELYNWGTFNKQVWTLTLDGKNALVTGDIGSGKSTLVDAITTLLVPAHRVAYNKAAGADSRERTLRSYVLGYYKAARDEDSNSAKQVALRTQNDYSVILGVFENKGYNQTVTLAQVFHMKEQVGQPARTFVAMERESSITKDFSNFGSDISGLRKKLRANGAELFDTFPPYGAWFRRRFGIQHEQALELFHQTISMKSVGNLTEFVRTHMLESFEVQTRIDALIGHFDDLNSAHEAVIKAARQIELLKPLVIDCEKRAVRFAQSESLKLCRDALRPYFAGLKVDLLTKRICSLEDDRRRSEAQIGRLERELRDKRIEEGELKQNIQENGGTRIEQLSAQITQQTDERLRRKHKADRYHELISLFGHTSAISAVDFDMQTNEFAEQLLTTRDREADLQNEITEVSLSLRRSMENHDLLTSEIKSLKSRRSNIPLEQVSMRDILCRALNMREEELPFAGELLQVRDEERDWEGAVERVLRSFGLSLLVPDSQYASVADWVDRTHLKGRLVYFRIRTKATTAVPQLQHNSLAKKVAIKPDSNYYDWLEREIAHRFDLVCCDNQEQFRRETKAITLMGQIKMPGDRHEKDDRHRVDDRSRFVLGWTNTAKITALEGTARQVESEAQQFADRITTAQNEQRKLKTEVESLTKLEEYTDFRDIDWQSVAKDVERLEDEKRQLESASDLLRELTKRLAAVTSEVNDISGRRDEQLVKRATNDEKSAQAGKDLEESRTEVANAQSNFHLVNIQLLEEMRSEALGEHQLTVESCVNKESQVRSWLQDRIDIETREVRRLDDRIIKAMSDYKNYYQQETQEVDANVESAGEFEEMLKALQQDDLPRFQARFKDLLNENTIREVANFQSQLSRERETIKERISSINESLVRIPYNRDRYIVIETQATQDAEIRDFQTELRACTEGTFTGSEDEQYSEEKFLQVKSIIERFRGREGQTEMDRRWAGKVTDVRNWFTFSASERWCEDDTEYEHYTDSGGKSGGQKEKLAYTILAASLAYQFGLEWKAVRSRSFRFVVIDEAFGRGSDESARFALSLFEMLNLQLLVVTPVQKTNVIAPFVRNVGFVHNDGGSDSKVRNMSIEEYHAEKAKLLQ